MCGSVTTWKGLTKSTVISFLGAGVRGLACAGSEITDSLIAHASTGLDPVSIEDFTSEVLAVSVDQGKWTSCVAFCDRRRWFSRLWVVQGIGLPTNELSLADDLARLGQHGRDFMPPF